MTVKAVRASSNVSNVLYKNCTLVCYDEKEKYLYEITMSTFTKKKISPGLPNLVAQNRCAENWYMAIQRDVKYSLAISKVFVY